MYGSFLMFLSAGSAGLRESLEFAFLFCVCFSLIPQKIPKKLENQKPIMSPISCPASVRDSGGGQAIQFTVHGIGFISPSYYDGVSDAVTTSHPIPPLLLFSVHYSWPFRSPFRYLGSE